ncbi:hypothetical protein SLV14_007027 [Streptomyces sp. Je 1-4]|uniref:hypothetical protein n=1 Tax=Streptomyces TaxID=1883 RepID=UPI0021D9BA53|nr:MULTISPECIES: hypothetical protein [unclassified Streptomyces]UYB43980.1 hypothetical protein SLV14_007027 [Streptomyces sp. Je 1-4]UZQ40407.1 hypothetical protein SLV14N_007027 [Streptomyces sp. Je 1-4] [Streptomyces sp. Je 1-4 4N24]UZQ47824.1 hypothetical protein SLV14NA_007027 [Streptomyces sp. Je 1-4] [Streptomyces sp. Je 1-4 4N24_ara]
MKKSLFIAAPLALAASLALAPAASAAPAKTPALSCHQVVDLKKLPAGTNLDLVYQAAKALGLTEVPTVIGGACNQSIRTDADSGKTEYGDRGQVILRTEEFARDQQYCTDSRSVDGGKSFIPGLGGPEVPGRMVFGSGCTSEPNPLIF